MNKRRPLHIGSSLFMVIIKFFVPNKLVDSIRTVSYLQTDSYCLRILEGPLLFSHFVEFLVLSKLKRNSNHIIILYIFFLKKGRYCSIPNRMGIKSMLWTLLNSVFYLTKRAIFSKMWNIRSTFRILLN